MADALLVPFGPWLPDPPDFGVEGLRVCENLVPTEAGWRGILTPRLVSTIENDLVNAAHSHRVFADMTDALPGSLTRYLAVPVYQAGSSGSLYSYEFGTWHDVSQFVYAVTFETSPWRFVSWGNTKVLATNYGNPIQTIDYSHISAAAVAPSPATSMITSTAKPQAKYIAVLGQHVVLVNVYLPSSFSGLASGAHPQLIWWSATDDEATFGDESSHPGEGTGYQPRIEAPGEFTGVAAVGEDALVLFKPYAIEVMSRTGGEDLFAFSTLHRGVGTIHDGSIVTLGRDVYFVSSDGRLKVLRNLGAVEDLGSGSAGWSFVDRRHAPDIAFSLLNTLDGSARIRAIADEGSQTLFWFYTPIEDPSVANKVFCYHAPSGRFSLLTDDDLDVLAVTGASFVATDSWTSELPDHPMGVFILNHETGDSVMRRFGAGQDGAAYPARVKTQTIGLIPIAPQNLAIGYKTSRVLRTRPIYRTPATHYAPQPKIRVYASTSPDMVENLVDTNWLDPQDGFVVSEGGWYDMPSGSLRGTFFEFEVSWPSGSDYQIVRDAIGLQVEGEPTEARR